MHGACLLGSWQAGGPAAVAGMERADTCVTAGRSCRHATNTILTTLNLHPPAIAKPGHLQVIRSAWVAEIRLCNPYRPSDKRRHLTRQAVPLCS